MMIRTLIADPDEIMREGVKQLLISRMDVCVVGQADSSEGVLSQVVERNADLLVLEPELDGRRGAVLIREIRSLAPRLPILVCADSRALEVAGAAFRSGANGFITKQCGVEALLNAVEHISEGRTYVSPRVGERLATEAFSKSRSHSSLTVPEREMQVFKRLADGRTLTDIAAELGLNIKTVSTYKARLMRRLGLSSYEDLLRYAALMEP